MNKSLEWVIAGLLSAASMVATPNVIHADEKITPEAKTSTQLIYVNDGIVTLLKDGKSTAIAEGELPRFESNDSIIFAAREGIFRYNLSQNSFGPTNSMNFHSYTSPDGKKVLTRNGDTLSIYFKQIETDVSMDLACRSYGWVNADKIYAVRPRNPGQMQITIIDTNNPQRGQSVDIQGGVDVSSDGNHIYTIQNDRAIIDGKEVWVAGLIDNNLIANSAARLYEKVCAAPEPGKLSKLVLFGYTALSPNQNNLAFIQIEGNSNDIFSLANSQTSVYLHNIATKETKLLADDLNIATTLGWVDNTTLIVNTIKPVPPNDNVRKDPEQKVYLFNPINIAPKMLPLLGYDNSKLNVDHFRIYNTTTGKHAEIDGHINLPSQKN